MQLIWIGRGEAARQIELPGELEEVLPGIKWGRPCSPVTPAYWAVRCRSPDEVEKDAFVSPQDSLLEAVGFCLLGGFGIKYESNEAAYRRLKDCGVFDPNTNPTEDDIRKLLVEPLIIEGRAVRYRFPNQRARRLLAMRQELADVRGLSKLNALELRAKLQRIEGVGPKTASWIVRNLRGSDEVAILDVHVIRACRAMNLFPDIIRLPQDYDGLERRFLAFADGIGIRPSLLDAIMWTEVRGGI